MEQTLFSKKELTKRWGISVATLDRRVREGKIKPATIKPIRFNINDILKAEGTDNSKLSFFERRKLEAKIEELTTELEKQRKENIGIKRQLTNVVAEIMPILTEGREGNS